MWVGILMFVVLPIALLVISFRIKPLPGMTEQSALYKGLASHTGVEPDEGIAVKEDENVKFNL